MGSVIGTSVCSIAGVVALSVGLTLSVGERVAKGLAGLDGRSFEGFEVATLVGSEVGSNVTSPSTGATVGDGEILGVAEGAHSSGIRRHASGLRVVSC